MTLHKFKNALYEYVPTSGSTINYSYVNVKAEYLYIDIERVTTFFISHDPPGTTLVIDGAGSITVGEHISEVIAILEGRDAMPSRILFSKDKKHGKES